MSSLLPGECSTCKTVPAAPKKKSSDAFEDKLSKPGGRASTKSILKRVWPYFALFNSYNSFKISNFYIFTRYLPVLGRLHHIECVWVNEIAIINTSSSCASQNLPRDIGYLNCSVS